MSSVMLKFLLALAVTGMEIPHLQPNSQLDADEDADDLREEDTEGKEQTEVAFEEQEFDSSAQSQAELQAKIAEQVAAIAETHARIEEVREQIKVRKVAELEATLAEQVAAIAATHKEMDALRAELRQDAAADDTADDADAVDSDETVGLYVRGLEMVNGPTQKPGCIEIMLDTGAGLAHTPIKLKVWKGDPTWNPATGSYKSHMGLGGTAAIFESHVIDMKTPRMLHIFDKGADYGAGNCPPVTERTGEVGVGFAEMRMPIELEYTTKQTYCVTIAVEKEKNSVKKWVEGPRWLSMSKGKVCFMLNCKFANGGVGVGDGASSCRSEGPHWMKTAGKVFSLGGGS